MHANKGDRIVVESVTIDSARPSGQHLPNPQQQSFDELATLRASNEANADQVIAEVLASQPTR